MINLFSNYQIQFKQFLILGRYHSLIGAWLLFFPCLLTFLLHFDGQMPLLKPIIFLIGAIIMRAAGCTLNDIMDRDIDKKVARTKTRPLASGALTVQQAIIFFFLQVATAGSMVILFLPKTTILLSLLSLIIVGVYPLAKRFTNWPQVILGLAFGVGVFIATSAIEQTPNLATYLLFIMCVIWTTAYDTIYAHQDRFDDQYTGIGSSALTLGVWTKPFLILSYGLCYILFIIIGSLHNLSWLFYISSITVLGHFTWQIKVLDISNPKICGQIFHSNKLLGLLMAIAVLLGKIG